MFFCDRTGCEFQRNNSLNNSAEPMNKLTSTIEFYNMRSISLKEMNRIVWKCNPENKVVAF